MKTRNNNIKITACLFFAFLLALLCTVPAFAEMRQNMLSPEDGVVSDSGEHSPLDPDAGTVEGTGDGIFGGAQSAFDSFGDTVSDAASDMLGGMGETSNRPNASTASDSGMSGAENTGGNIAAAVIICIIIAIAVIVLIIILIPKKKD